MDSKPFLSLNGKALMSVFAFQVTYDYLVWLLPILLTVQDFDHIREFKQITTAFATTAAVTEKFWREYVSVVCQILAKRNTKMSET